MQVSLQQAAHELIPANKLLNSTRLSLRFKRLAVCLLPADAFYSCSSSDEAFPSLALLALEDVHRRREKTFGHQPPRMDPKDQNYLERYRRLEQETEWKHPYVAGILIALAQGLRSKRAAEARAAD